MEAIVLAAGRGTRMRGLCDRIPKPMLPVANKPVLDVIVQRLALAGIDRVFLVVGHLADHIRDHFRQFPPPIPVEFILQDKARGTGHAALLGRGRMKEEPFLLAFGDIFVSGHNYSGMVARFDESRPDILLATRYVEDPWRGAAVYVDNRGQVTRIIEKPAPGSSTTHYDNAGVFCFKPRVWDLLEEVKISPRGEYELTDAIAATLAQNGRILAYELAGYWLNLTGPEEMIQASRCLLEETTGDHDLPAGACPPCAVHPTARIAPGARVGPNASVGAACRVGPNAVVEDAILMQGATVGAGGVVRHAILAPGAAVADGAQAAGQPAAAAVISA